MQTCRPVGSHFIAPGGVAVVDGFVEATNIRAHTSPVCSVVRPTVGGLRGRRPGQFKPLVRQPATKSPTPSGKTVVDACVAPSGVIVLGCLERDKQATFY
jgi:hypothetical protein